MTVPSTREANLVIEFCTHPPRRACLPSLVPTVAAVGAGATERRGEAYRRHEVAESLPPGVSPVLMLMRHIGRTAERLHCTVVPFSNRKETHFQLRDIFCKIVCDIRCLNVGRDRKLYKNVFPSSVRSQVTFFSYGIVQIIINKKG